MFRVTLFAAFAVASLGQAGCVGTWDTLTSRRFRDHPMETMQKMVSPEDPVMVLRADPPRDGDERADAMRRLKEPIRNKGTRDDQDAIVELLAWTARYDPSPVLRMEAIGALSRFEDPRVAGSLIAAYQNCARPQGIRAAAQAAIDRSRRDPDRRERRPQSDPGAVRSIASRSPARPATRPNG